MIIDSSALMALINAEPIAEAIEKELEQALILRLSAATYVEIHAVLIRTKRPEQRERLNDYMRSFNVQIEPFTPEQAEIAARAYRDYGRGSGHPANLNLGDVYSYALAKTHHEPVLCTGDDLSRTDLRTRPEPTA